MTRDDAHPKNADPLIDTRLRAADDEAPHMALDATQITARVASRRHTRRARRQVGGALLVLGLVATAWLARPPVQRPALDRLAQHNDSAATAHRLIDELEEDSDSLVAWASSVASMQSHLADLDVAALTVQEQATSTKFRRDASRSLTLDTPLDFMY